MTSIGMPMSGTIFVIPLHAHIATETRPDSDVDGTVTVEGVQLWRDTYPPGTTHEAVLSDMLSNLADVLNDARLGR